MPGSSSLRKLVDRYIQSSTKVVDSCHAHHSHGLPPIHLEDEHLWFRDLAERELGSRQGDDPVGAISMAVVQANAPLEDQCQVLVGEFGALVGVYDGHGGPEASRFVSQHLFPKIEALARECGGGKISAEVLRRALGAVEEEFVRMVRKQGGRLRPGMMLVGSCCLVGAMVGTHLYVANLGDSRVVLGTAAKHGGGKGEKMVAVRLSREHNAGNPEVREELRSQHPHDPDIVKLSYGVWRVKGIIQVSRSIGDVHLKAIDHSGVGGVLSAEPSLHERQLSADDRFLIFASDGLWDVMSDQEAVDIVHKGPSNGIARILAATALGRVAERYRLRWPALAAIRPGLRRRFHDDISIVIVYLGKKSSIQLHSDQRGPLRADAPLDIVTSPG